jgi:hypothetical protein
MLMLPPLPSKPMPLKVMGEALTLPPKVYLGLLLKMWIIPVKILVTTSPPVLALVPLVLPILMPLWILLRGWELYPVT